MIVLQVFSDTANTSFGVFLFFSRQTCQNLRGTIRDQASQVFNSTDGTYKIHEGGWTSVNLGTYMIWYEREKFSKHIILWTFMLVKSESEFGKSVFGAYLQVKFCSLDYRAAIANAYQTEWPVSIGSIAGLTSRKKQGSNDIDLMTYPTLRTFPPHVK